MGYVQQDPGAACKPTSEQLIQPVHKPYGHVALTDRGVLLAVGRDPHGGLGLEDDVTVRQVRSVQRTLGVHVVEQPLEESAHVGRERRNLDVRQLASARGRYPFRHRHNRGKCVARIADGPDVGFQSVQEI